MSSQDFDCAVHVPLSENCGGVVEPLLSAVPTIAGEVGGLPEVVQHGRTGETVPVRRPDLLAKSILRVLDHCEEHQCMADRGRRLCAQMFDAERCGREVVSVYRHILDGEPQSEEFDSVSFVDRLAFSGCSNASAPQALAVFGVAVRYPANKRILDIVVSSLAVAALSPILGVLSILVRWRLGSPILFRQRRTGLHGQLFTCLKFRTMTNACDPNHRLLPDVRRLTSLGRFLRNTSLDELPELLNVIRGEMSLVGPRPLLPEYLDRYSSEQMRRHDVKPGITGWAQINGRNALDWNRKFELDLWYVDHWSLWLDLKILVRTSLQVLRCDGISRPGHATMPEFMGTSTEREQGNV